VELHHQFRRGVGVGDNLDVSTGVGLRRDGDCVVEFAARHQSIGQRGVALNREALVQALSGLIRRPGGFTKSIVAWVTLTVPVCLATTRLVAPCRWPAISPTTASFKSTVVDSRWGRGALTRGSSAGLLVSHRRRHRNPGAVPRCFG